MLNDLLYRPPLIYLTRSKTLQQWLGLIVGCSAQIRLPADDTVEVFKFGCYVFFPILAMLKFGDPEW